MAESIGLDEIRSALKAAGDPWVAGVTSLSELPLAEKMKYLGVTPPPGEPGVEEIELRWKSMEMSLKTQALGTVGMPSAYDLRSIGGKNFVTPIRNQKSCGSCVAFGTVATVESNLRLQRSNPDLAVDLSEAHLFFCYGRDKGATCSTGWWPNEALDAFKSGGVADEACYSYDDGLAKQDCSGLCANWKDRVTKITGYTAMTGNPAKIKEWISNNVGPVCACFIVYEDFFSYTSGIYKYVSGAKAGGHCVTIVGYNDSLGYWICKNSWGTGWGEQGFFRIAYGQCGIDSWMNLGVNSIENTGWQTNCHVTGLWTIDQDRNAWAYLDGLGWRKISPDNDNIFFDMLAVLIAAKAAARPVNFYEENSVIKQVYVF